MPPRRSSSQSEADQSAAASSSRHTLTVDDLSYTPSPEEQQRDALQMSMTGRKGFKTIKDQGEAVWPSHLEAALFEGLKQYQLKKSGSNRQSGRFHMRNKFISDHIFEATGKRRTPRQVGSRLQQLKDTPGGRQILERYSRPLSGAGEAGGSPAPSGSQRGDSQEQEPRPSPSGHGRSSSGTPGEHRSLAPSTGISPPMSPINTAATFYSHQARRLVDITVSSRSSFFSTPVLTVGVDNAGSVPWGQQINPDWTTGQASYVADVPSASSSGGVTPALGMQGLPPSADPGIAEAPAVTFTSASLVQAESHFTVYYAGADQPCHLETTPLLVLSSTTAPASYGYRTTIIPQYWAVIRDSAGEHPPPLYTIKQELVGQNHTPPLAPAQVPDDAQYTRQVVATIFYQFAYRPDPAVRATASMVSAQQVHITAEYGAAQPGNLYPQPVASYQITGAHAVLGQVQSTPGDPGVWSAQVPAHKPDLSPSPYSHSQHSSGHSGSSSSLAGEPGWNAGYRES